MSAGGVALTAFLGAQLPELGIVLPSMFSALVSLTTDVIEERGRRLVGDLEAVGITRRDIEEAIANEPRVADVLGTVVTAAFATDLRAKRRALAHTLRRALDDPSDRVHVDVEHRIALALAALGELELIALQAICEMVQEGDWDENLMWRGDVARRPELTEQLPELGHLQPRVLADLLAEGLVTDVGTGGSGALYAVAPTPFGRQLLAYVREAEEELASEADA